MRCPGCEEFNHLFWYVRFGQPQKYAMETNAVYMCPKYKGGCGHIFSPGDHSLLVQILNHQTSTTVNGHDAVEEQSSNAA